MESTTMSDMTPTESTTEPRPVSDGLTAFRDRLRARGLEVPEPGETTPMPTEDPEDAELRRRQRADNLSARWLEKCPVMYQGASVESLDENQHAIRVRSWLYSGALHLVLAGPVGTGKTYAAYAVGNQALAAGKWVEGWAVGDLMDQLRPGQQEATLTWHRARSCQVLILDDLAGKATDWEAERMTLLLDARVRNQLQTVVTTNVTSATIAEVWGGRFMDRLGHRMSALTFQGESRRGGAW